MVPLRTANSWAKSKLKSQGRTLIHFLGFLESTVSAMRFLFHYGTVPVDSNQAFCDNALYWAQILHSICDVDQAIVQSWEQYPDQNVPDNQPYTFTKLLRDYTATIASVPFPNPDVAMIHPGQVTIHGRTGASYYIETLQDLRLPNLWQNAALIEMETPDTIWTDPAPTNASKFYRVIGER